MKQKTMILIALAVVCGLGASFMTSKLLADRQTAEETIKVLVAKKNLDTGIIIKKPEEVFVQKDVLKDTAPKNVLTKIEEVMGRQLKIPRREGDTITQDDLHDDKTNGLMGNLPPGHRAVGIRVSSEQIAAGFAAVPHSRIDITCTVKSNNEKDSGTRIILQNVLVLASGQSTVRDEGGKPMLCEVVTVALTPQDCLKLETSKNKGGLSMLLRPYGDNTVVKTNTVTWDDVTRGKKGDDKDYDPDDDGKKSGPIATGPESVPIPPFVSTTPKFEQPTVNEKFITRVTNAETVKYSWVKDADGQWESRPEPAAEPNNNGNNNGTPASPAPRSAQQPGTAATPAPVPSPTPAPTEKR
jgi:pilus assembly protein CpaB